jgi:hypothetical protein
MSIGNWVVPESQQDLTGKGVRNGGTKGEAPLSHFHRSPADQVLTRDIPHYVLRVWCRLPSKKAAANGHPTLLRGVPALWSACPRRLARLLASQNRSTIMTLRVKAERFASSPAWIRL